MTRAEYIRLIRRARRAHLALDPVVAARLLEAIRAYSARLGRELRARSRRGFVPRANRLSMLRAAEEASRELERALIETTRQGIRLSAAEVAEITDRATSRFVVEEARSRLSSSQAEELIGVFVDGGDLRGASAYLSRLRAGEEPIASRFATLLHGHVDNAAAEVDYILTRGITERVQADRLARRLRGYMVGAEDFGSHLVVDRDADGEVIGRRIDLRELEGDKRRAAEKLAFRAERIAITEKHNAAHEATAEAMRASPQVKGVEWNLSLDRGSGGVPDACDVLAQADYYGLGAGIYPVESVPPLPHPFCRCFQVPVFRPFDEWREPKPSGSLRAEAGTGSVSGGTETRRQRAAENAGTVVAGVGP